MIAQFADSFRYLILTYNTSIQVYSAVDSLLVRRIPISTIDATETKAAVPTSIVATRLSKENRNYIWVACSDGRIFYVDWTSSKVPTSFRTRTGTARALALKTLKIGGKEKEIVFVAESDKPNRIEVVAYDGTAQPTPESKSILVMKKQGNGLQILESNDDSQVLLGAFNDRLFLGSPAKQEIESLEGLHYDFYTFDTPDLVTSLDLRVYSRPNPGSKKAKMSPSPVVDILVGGARGSIYLYHDALARSLALGKSGSEKDMIQAQKFHWHRKAVHAVKWSRDGTHFICAIVGHC